MNRLELNDEKLYYSIGEVSKLFNVNSSLIRFWEKEFKQLSPKKTDSGKRKFTKKDIQKIEQIYYLVKEKGYTLSGAKEHMKSSKKEGVNQQELLKKLEGVKKSLKELMA